MLTRILTAAAFSALLAGAAAAQDTPPPADPAADAMAQGMTEPAPMTDATTTAAVVVAPPPADATNVTVRTVTNGPVPDTAENRAKYGQPMSNAGKRTTPAGN